MRRTTFQTEVLLLEKKNQQNILRAFRCECQRFLKRVSTLEIPDSIQVRLGQHISSVTS